MSGLQADARSMVEHARVESQNHAFHYNEPLRVESCTQAICDLALRFGEGADGEESIMSRPFGVALLIAGFDEGGPQLWVALFPCLPFLRYLPAPPSRQHGAWKGSGSGGVAKRLAHPTLNPNRSIHQTDSPVHGGLQIPRRAVRDLLPLRRQGDRVRQRGGAGGAAERVPQVADAGGGGDAGAEDAEAGHGGEARRQERAAGQRHAGQGLSHLRG